VTSEGDDAPETETIPPVVLDKLEVDLLVLLSKRSGQSPSELASQLKLNQEKANYYVGRLRSLQLIGRVFSGPQE
jgi:hypothetical protein